MKKIIYLIFIILFLYGCVQNTNNANVQIQKPQKLLKICLDSLIKVSPNMLNNEITKQDFATLLTLEMLKYRGDTLHFLSELPFEFEMLMQYNTGKYVIKFGFGEYTSKYVLSEEYKTTFQVFSIVDRSIASQLVENSRYYITGKFKDFANCKGSFTLPSGKCFDGYPKISESYGKPYIDIGTLIIEDISFAPVNRY